MYNGAWMQPIEYRTVTTKWRNLLNHPLCLPQKIQRARQIMQFACFTILAAYLPSPCLHAQSNSVVPHAVPLPPPVEAPSDIAYRGVIHLNIDATDVLRRIYQIQEIIPVGRSGEKTRSSSRSGPPATTLRMSRLKSLRVS